MSLINMQYGKSNINLSVPEENLLGILDGKGEKKSRSVDELIVKALENPVGSVRLREKVSPKDKVCIVISDITRSWQRIDLYLPHIIKELNEAGVEDNDITLLCANGTHRKQSEEEQEILIGKEMHKRFKVYDHDCLDESNMMHIGTTSFGTPVSINKIAMKCDLLILTGAAVFHDMAGFGGGRKSILPGISAYSTIMANHSLSLSHELGGGSNKLTRSGKLKGNPMHEDMLEAALMAKPDFLFNVVIDETGEIAYAAAGDLIEAHESVCAAVKRWESANIKEKADIVIASAGGYPKDINLYQGSKALTNAREAAKEGGTIIIACECVEGFGSGEMEYIIDSFKDNLEREKELRRNYTIAKYTGFLVTEIAEKYKIILVSKLKSYALYKSGIIVMDSLEKAFEIVLAEKIKAKVYVMPHAASTLPVFFEK